MTLTTAINKARATRERRHTQLLAELRIDEVLLTEQVRAHHESYWAEDGRGDNAFEDALSAAARLLRAEVINHDAMRDALAEVYMVRERWEKREESHVRYADQTNRSLLSKQRENNPAFIDGQYVPTGSDGAA